MTCHHMPSHSASHLHNAVRAAITAQGLNAQFARTWTTATLANQRKRRH